MHLIEMIVNEHYVPDHFGILDGHSKPLGRDGFGNIVNRKMLLFNRFVFFFAQSCNGTEMERNDGTFCIFGRGRKLTNSIERWALKFEQNPFRFILFPHGCWWINFQNKYNWLAEISHLGWQMQTQIKCVCVWACARLHRKHFRYFSSDWCGVATFVSLSCCTHSHVQRPAWITFHFIYDRIFWGLFEIVLHIFFVLVISTVQCDHRWRMWMRCDLFFFFVSHVCLMATAHSNTRIHIVPYLPLRRILSSEKKCAQIRKKATPKPCSSARIYWNAANESYMEKSEENMTNKNVIVYLCLSLSHWPRILSVECCKIISIICHLAPISFRHTGFRRRYFHSHFVWFVRMSIPVLSYFVSNENIQRFSAIDSAPKGTNTHKRGGRI